MTNFLAAPGLLLEKVPEPAGFVSPFAWCPTPPGRNTALLLLLEHEAAAAAAAAAASSAIFTSSPMKSTESSNLNFFWMCSGVGEQEEEEEEEEEFRVLGGEEEMVSAVSSLSEPFIFLFFGDVMLPLSFLTLVAACLASWVGGGGGLGEDKPVGNMKKTGILILNSQSSDPKLPGLQGWWAPSPRASICPNTEMFHRLSTVKHNKFQTTQALLEPSLVSFLLLLAGEERWLAIASSFCLSCRAALWSPPVRAVESSGR